MYIDFYGLARSVDYPYEEPVSILVKDVDCEAFLEAAEDAGLLWNDLTHPTDFNPAARDSVSQVEFFLHPNLDRTSVALTYSVNSRTQGVNMKFLADVIELEPLEEMEAIDLAMVLQGGLINA